MPAGRPPTPIPIAEKLGNPGHRRLKVEPKIRHLRPKLDQEWLDEAARDYLAQIVPELERAGLLTVIDGPGLALLADRYAEVLALRELVRRTGIQRAIALGQVNAFRRAEESYRRWADSYGLSALARTRMAGADGGDEEDESGLDPL